MDPIKVRERMRARVPQAGRWYEIRNQDGDKAVVRIYDEISYWGITADDFAREIAAISTPEIEVQINSPGGDVFDGLAIYNALRTHPAHITTRVDGIAASAASVIVQAGDRRVIVESAQLMIHEAWGLAIGPAREMREFADLLDKQNDVIAGIYATRSDKDVAHFRELMSTDTYLTDQEAVDLGLADEVYVPPRKGADAAAAAIREANPELAAETDALTEQLKAVFGDNERRAELGLPPIQTPSAGEREDQPPAGEQPVAISAEQRDTLLGALTLQRKEAL